MGLFSKIRTLTKAQLQERAKRRNNRPGRYTQPKGTPPYEHRLPENPVFKPIETEESKQAKVDEAVLETVIEKTKESRITKVHTSYYCMKCQRTHKSGKIYDEHWRFRATKSESE